MLRNEVKSKVLNYRCLYFHVALCVEGRERCILSNFIWFQQITCLWFDVMVPLLQYTHIFWTWLNSIWTVAIKLLVSNLVARLQKRVKIVDLWLATLQSCWVMRKSAWSFLLWALYDKSLQNHTTVAVHWILTPLSDDSAPAYDITVQKLQISIYL